MTTPTNRTEILACEHQEEIWGPHEGCYEFMTEPEAVVPCDANATHRVEFLLPARETGYFCGAHVPEVDSGILEVSYL